MYNKNIKKKSIALATVALVAANSTCAFAAKTDTKVTKDETVYSILDENGNVTKNIVSDWIKSDSSLGNIKDVSKLTNIKNIKGNEKPSINGDNVVIEYSILPIVDNLVLFVDKGAVLTVVDLLLGGNGQVEDLNREPTNIDLELLKYLFDNLLKRIYMPATHEKIEVNRIYPNKIQYQKLNTKDMIFSSLINVLLQNEVVGHIRFCIPYESMKDIIDDFGSDKLKHEDNFEEEKCKDISCSEIFPYIKNIDVDVTAKLGCAKVSISDLLNLEVGDVILLDQKINENITVDIGEANIYKAKPGVIGMKKGIEIIDIIR